MTAAETAKLVTQLDLKDNLTSGLSRAEQAVGRFGGVAKMGMADVKKGAGQLASGLARVGAIAGTVAVGALAGAAKAAIDFDDAMAGVRKTLDEQDLTKVGLSFDKLALSFRNMATEVPISASMFARLGEQAGALGVAAKDIEVFAKTAALLGVTTNLTADAAADGLGRLGTILKFTGKDYQEYADILVNLGNKGASTESEILEISKRFAAEGRAAGLAKDQIAALGSATASLGFEPERGGTALSRVFASMSTNISVANDKGKAFAEVTGKSIKQLQRDINNGKGLGIFMDVLESLKGMSATEASKTLLALGVTNASDRNIFRTMSENLPFINDQLEVAANSTGALSEEATKRFDTVRSKFQLLKNNLIEAGITLGEGFAPALGRAAERISGLIKNNKGDLVGLGKEIGAVIDGIDFKAILDGARTFAGLLREGLQLIKLIPPQVTLTVAGLLGLNKLSGGLFGEGIKNVVGGAIGMGMRGVVNKIPGLNKLTAQPVYVTNWNEAGLMGGGGVPGAAAGGLGSKLMTGLKIAGAVTIAGASIAALAEQFGTFQETTKQAQADLQEKADAAANQNSDEALANLRKMNQKLSGLSGLDQALADTFGGEQIADGLRNLSRSVVSNGKLSASEITSAIDVLKEAQKHALARGNTKVADEIGADIKTLQARQTAAQARTTAAVQGTKATIAAGDRSANAKLATIAAKDTSVVVNTTTSVTSSISVRDAQSAYRVSNRYGFVAQ